MWKFPASSLIILNDQEQVWLTLQLMSTLGILNFRKSDSLLPPRLVSSPRSGELIGLLPGTIWRHSLNPRGTLPNRGFFPCSGRKRVRETTS